MARRRRENASGTDLVAPLAMIFAGCYFLSREAVDTFISTALRWGGYLLLIGTVVFIASRLLKLRSPKNPTRRIVSPSQLVRDHKPDPKAKSGSMPENKFIFDKYEKGSALSSKSHPELTIEVLKEMDWKGFEVLCRNYYTIKGFDSRLTGTGADGGVDVILERIHSNGEKLTVYVQCKAWSQQKVGVKAIRELYGVMAADSVKVGIFITTSSFTDDAKQFAEGKRLQLVTGTRLLELIRKLPEDKQ